jgi:hypothetical protein
MPASPVTFHPISRKQATSIWHRARRLDQRTSRKGRHGGIIGRAALQVLSVLIFDYLNFQTGRLDPSQAAIARKARMCERTVRTALARLKALGIISWIKRCFADHGPWGVLIKQETNAYSLHSPPILDRQEPPPPAPWQLGLIESHPEALSMAVERLKDGDRIGMLAALESDPKDELALLWASFYRAVAERENRTAIGAVESCP